jgi:hypothetical protein
MLCTSIHNEEEEIIEEKISLKDLITEKNGKNWLPFDIET